MSDNVKGRVAIVCEVPVPDHRPTETPAMCFMAVHWFDDLDKAKKSLRELPEGSYHIVVFNEVGIEVAVPPAASVVQRGQLTTTRRRGASA